MTKITFLTGAGASFASGSVIPFSPPLGANLYESLENVAPSIMNQITQIVGSKNKDNFEKKMYEMWKSNKLNGFAINRFFARYFSQFSPLNDNLYIDLAQIIQNNDSVDWLYSTLNYDCLFELAASSIGIKINYDPGVKNNDSLDILKIHGSCNFINNAMTGPENSLSAGMAAGLIDGGGVEFVQPKLVSTILKQRPLGPVMAYYMQNKPTITNKSFLEKLQKEWKAQIKKSNKIILIGIKPNPQDTHIWNPIISSNAKIGYVGSASGFKALKKMNPKKSPVQIATSFETSISAIESFV